MIIVLQLPYRLNISISYFRTLEKMNYHKGWNFHYLILLAKLLKFTWFFKSSLLIFSGILNILLIWFSRLPFGSATDIVYVLWDSMIVVVTWSNFNGMVHKIFSTTLLYGIYFPYTLILLTKLITREKCYFPVSQLDISCLLYSL